MMARTRPGRLYRKLQPAQPLFQFTTEAGTLLRDDMITGVTINRGDGSPAAGVKPSTLEVGLSVFGSVQSNNHCELSLTSYGAQLLANRTGASAAGIRARFAGRVGKQSVDDRGRRQITTMLASSWASQLGRVAGEYTPAPGAGIGIVIGQMMTSAALPRLAPPTRLAPPDHYGIVHEVPTPQTWSDIGRWTSDLGITVRETRLGGHQIMSHAQRWQDALDAMPGRAPLIRGQALAPASWEQPADSIPRNHLLRWGVSGGTAAAEFGAVDDPHAVVVEHDVTHARFNNEDQIRSEGQRRRYIDFNGNYSISSLKIDLLGLITSPSPYDRQQAARLLSMQVDDAVYLSGDWYGNLQGIHFATGITETISGSGWSVNLSISPSHLVVGEISPAVPARVWASATYPWRDETRTWNAV